MDAINAVAKQHGLVVVERPARYGGAAGNQAQSRG